MDFAKKEDILINLAHSRYDLIIVDEAHKMSAYSYGDKVSKSNRYKLGEVLSEISNHLLFLTATPHKGDTENFRLFLDLLQPGFFASKEQIENSIRDKDNPLFIRRTKEDLKNFDGKPLFLPRNVKTIHFDLGKDSPEEKELYNELSKYITTQYNISLKKNKNKYIYFTLIILQRRFASSIYALTKTLKRRLHKLEDLISKVSQFNNFNNFYDDIDNIDELAEEERWEIENQLETISLAQNREELENEINTIKKLIKKADDILTNEKEIKLKKLKDSLNKLDEKLEDKDKTKIIIFTESKDTLDYLEKKVKEWGYSVITIYGGMKLEERVNAEKFFKNEKQILIATEAASEGINLQFCNQMINTIYHGIQTA